MTTACIALALLAAVSLVEAQDTWKDVRGSSWGDSPELVRSIAVGTLVDSSARRLTFSGRMSGIPVRVVYHFNGDGLAQVVAIKTGTEARDVAADFRRMLPSWSTFYGSPAEIDTAAQASSASEGSRASMRARWSTDRSRVDMVAIPSRGALSVTFSRAPQTPNQ